MMKKLLAVLLLTALTLSLGFFAMAEDDFTAMECVFLNYFDKSADSWMSTEYNRCHFTFMAYVDYFCHTGYDEYDDAPLDWTSPTYCGRSDDDVLVAVAGITVKGVEKTLYVIYAPATGQASYSVGQRLPSRFIEVFFDAVCPNEYYTNGITEMINVRDDIIKTFSSNN